MRRDAELNPTHTSSVLCEWWLSGICLMTNTDCTGGSDPLEWEPLRLLNPPGYSVSVIKVISRLIMAHYLQPIPNLSVSVQIRWKPTFTCTVWYQYKYIIDLFSHRVNFSAYIYHMMEISYHWTKGKQTTTCSLSHSYVSVWVSMILNDVNAGV